MPSRKVDALVIGSGVGGLCVAARLVAEGLKVEVIEKLDCLGRALLYSRPPWVQSDDRGHHGPFWRAKRSP